MSGIFTTNSLKNFQNGRDPFLLRKFENTRTEGGNLDYLKNQCATFMNSL